MFRLSERKIETAWYAVFSCWTHLVIPIEMSQMACELNVGGY